MKKTLGSVGGGVGLLLLLFTAPVAYVTFDSLIPFIVAMVVGGAGVAMWIITRGERVSSSYRSAVFFSSSVGLAFAFLAVLIALNVIVAKRSPTWDLTKNQIYSLSPQTKTTLGNLKGPVKVIAFVEGAIPESAETLFGRYAEVNDRFSFEFKDPRRSPDLTQRYQIRKGQPAAVLSSEKDGLETHVILNLGRLVSPIIGEQELTNGLMKLEAVGTQKLYFLTGHGEVPLDPLAQSEEAIKASLQALKRILQDEGYAPESLNLVSTGAIPSDASAIVIGGARSRYSPQELKLIETYLLQGGRLLYFAEAGSEPGLDALLSQWAAQIEPGIVADAKVNPENPFFLYTPFLGDHELTRLLLQQQANVIMPTARGITKLGSGTLDGLEVTPLVLTTPYAWIELTPAENPKQDPEERAGQIILAMAVTRDASEKPQRAAQSRVVIVGDSDILNGTFAHEPNRNLVLNAFAWATQQLKLITVRPPDRDLSTVDLTQESLGWIRLVSLDLLPTLLLGVGLTIWLSRRSR